VASSSTHAQLDFTLKSTGLCDRFEGRTFSIDDVKHGTPEPDLISFAEQQIGVEPALCVVVDS